MCDAVTIIITCVGILALTGSCAVYAWMAYEVMNPPRPTKKDYEEDPR